MREWAVVTVALAGRSRRGDRLADEVGAADDDGLGAFEGDAVAAQELHARRAACTGAGPGRPLTSRPVEIGVSPSTSLAGSICVGQRRAVDLRRGRKLEQDAVDRRVRVELVQERADLLVRRVVRRAGDRSRGCPTSALAFCLPPT